MGRVGVRELRQQASAVLRRVMAGETVEVTDRGRPVAVLLPLRRAGLEKLEEEGLVRPAEADLLDLPPVPLPAGVELPSAAVGRGRAE
ncbi:MAG: prevent-host-death family protein [Thermoleophilia bacterium]